MRQCEHGIHQSSLYQILQPPVKDYIRVRMGLTYKEIYYYRILEVSCRINKKEASTESISRNSDHNKCFELEVVIEDRHFPGAWGSNKKEAEQKPLSTPW
jgi:dsRNA-specific ribonuclease